MGDPVCEKCMKAPAEKVMATRRGKEHALCENCYNSRCGTCANVAINERTQQYFCMNDGSTIMLSDGCIHHIWSDATIPELSDDKEKNQGAINEV